MFRLQLYFPSKVETLNPLESEIFLATSFVFADIHRNYQDYFTHILKQEIPAFRVVQAKCYQAAHGNKDKQTQNLVLVARPQ